jgi:hypothetical protein
MTAREVWSSGRWMSGGGRSNPGSRAAGASWTWGRERGSGRWRSARGFRLESLRWNRRPAWRSRGDERRPGSTWTMPAGAAIDCRWATDRAMQPGCRRSSTTSRPRRLRAELRRGCGRGPVLIRSAFGEDGQDHAVPLLPRGRACGGLLPSVDRTREAFEASFVFELLRPVAQVSVSDLRTYRARVGTGTRIRCYG